MPSHKMEGEDYKAGAGALSGERIFGDADPATAFRQYQANALWHGLRTLLRGEEVTTDELTAASGAADQTEGYIRLAKAIRRSSRRFQGANVANVTLSGSGNTVFTPSQDAFCFHLIDPTPTPAGLDDTVHPVPSQNDTQKNRLILIVNMTESRKRVGNSYYQKYVDLEPRESCWFYGLDESGSNTTIWQAIGRSFGNTPFQTFSAEVTGPGGTSGAGTVSYRRIGNKIELILPTMVFSCSGAGSNTYLQGAGGTYIPDLLTEGMPSASSGVPYGIGDLPGFINTAGYARLPFFTYDFGGGPHRRFLLAPPSGGYFPTATVGIAAGQASYFLPTT